MRAGSAGRATPARGMASPVWNMLTSAACWCACCRVFLFFPPSSRATQLICQDSEFRRSLTQFCTSLANNTTSHRRYNPLVSSAARCGCTFGHRHHCFSLVFGDHDGHDGAYVRKARHHTGPFNASAARGRRRVLQGLFRLDEACGQDRLLDHHTPIRSMAFLYSRIARNRASASSTTNSGAVSIFFAPRAVKSIVRIIFTNATPCVSVPDPFSGTAKPA